MQSACVMCFTVMSYVISLLLDPMYDDAFQVQQDAPADRQEVAEPVREAGASRAARKWRKKVTALCNAVSSSQHMYFYHDVSCCSTL